ncbi:MAG: electron transfer flavoprotein subunit alpha [Bacteroidetes bacterium GWF2_38_335]|nr:MAG: electron transfer flavoprotein subunit alpha [Bacteroidetes bacterium GWF2_38_335]OFY77454.1 MAG: electron transfer flavoprotein subunit alpha [Bacteroidetes bacterium RIFOXYA12_FULL_38_20]HBS87257.1 electron transfer flavoprotein subunit alpha [Bacteroidales bacterium]
MKILVCISNVPDTTTKIKFNNEKTEFDKTGVQWIINPWDELALTRALELKETSNGVITAVTVATVGLIDSEPTIRKALAIGADNAVRVNANPKDAYYVAGQIAEVVKKDGYEIVICGIESSDYNGSAVGGMLSEFLEYSSVSSVSGMNIDGGNIVVNREIDGGKETLAVKAPFVAVVQKGIAINPRIPNMRGIMMAKTKSLAVVEPAAMDELTSYETYELPAAKAACKMISAENVKELIDLLHNEAKVI